MRFLQSGGRVRSWPYFKFIGVVRSVNCHKQPEIFSPLLSSPLLSSPLPFSSLRKPLVPRVLSYITKYTPFCCWICAIQRVLHLNDLTILFSQLSRIFSVELNQLGQCSKLLSSIQVIVISTVLDFDMCYFTITPAKNTIIMLVQSEYS